MATSVAGNLTKYSEVQTSSPYLELTSVKPTATWTFWAETAFTKETDSATAWISTEPEFDSVTSGSDWRTVG